jgi:LPS sulfotransferase NodH
MERTGSWLLAHTLADTGYAGRPSDYFDEAERRNRTREWGLPDGRLTAYVRAMWNAATTPNGVLGPEADVERRSFSLRSGVRTAGGSGSPQPEIQPCEVLYEDLARDRLAVANRVLGFLRLPQLDAAGLPPVRHRKQADRLTERYVALVRSAVSSLG